MNTRCTTVLLSIVAAIRIDAQMPDAAAHGMAGTLGVPMGRMGSGTTWIPDAVPLPMRSTMRGPWMLMGHGVVTAQYDVQWGPRGDRQLGSLNWAMLMADRALAGGHLQLRFMPSVDAAMVGRCGYPLLLQSGESCHGGPLVDRQHPHDFFMELAALFERALTSRVGVTLYAAPAGEPALGPVAFMHRPSSMDDPNAPLGHHSQDATHINFGVVTAGIFTRTIKVEGSAFNGREPDENRWDLEPIRFDSYSGRVTVNPTPRWSVAAGYGYLRSPEALHPDESAHRVTASVLHGRAFGRGAAHTWASAFILGANRAHGRWSRSVLGESEAAFGSIALFARGEIVDRSAEDLALPADQPASVVGSVSVGVVRELVRRAGMTLGVGGRGTMNVVPSQLQAAYGSRTPRGAMIFLRVRPGHDARATPAMDHHHMP